MKENFSPLQAGSGEKKIHRYHQNAVKKKFSQLPAECGEKNFSPLKSQILQKFTALISTLILYSQEISLQKVTDGAVDYEVGHTHKVEVRTLVRQFLFCKNSVNAVKKNFHRKIQRYSYKNSPLSAHSTLKDAGALR